MPGEFQVIDIYRNLCQGLVSIEDVMMQDDQQVPQGTLVHDEKKPTTIINLLGHCKLEESMLEEVSTSFPAPSAGCTTVTEVPDQQLNTGTSPCHITNLDVYSGTDETLYDQENTDLKQEFTSMDDLMIAPGHEMDDVSDLLYFYATRDILSECKLLQISRDPMKWSKEDVARWLTHMCEKYGNLNVDLQCFNVDGSVLCRMTEDDFLLRSIYGCQIHAYLEIWKNYYKIEFEQADVNCANDTSRYNDTSVDSYQFETYSSGPGSPDGSSLNNIPSTATPSPITCQPTEEYFTSPEPKVEEVTRKHTEHKQTIHLWQFLKELLMKPESFSSCIKWVDRVRGIFKIEDSGRVAKEWGRRKNRPAMNYDKLSRSIRQYYKKGIIKKTEQSKRLVYQFCAPYL